MDSADLGSLTSRAVPKWGNVVRCSVPSRLAPWRAMSQSGIARNVEDASFARKRTLHVRGGQPCILLPEAFTR
jgi:hypothetical protein